MTRMLLGEHQHPGGVAQLGLSRTRLRRVADAVINDQPAVTGQDRGSAAPDFVPLPGRHRTGQPVMRCVVAEVRWFTVLHGLWAAGDPDALSMEVHHA